MKSLFDFLKRPQIIYPEDLDWNNITLKNISDVLRLGHHIEQVGEDALYISESGMLLELLADQHIIRLWGFFEVPEMPDVSVAQLEAYCNKINWEYIIVKTAFNAEEKNIYYGYDLVYGDKLNVRQLNEGIFRLGRIAAEMYGEFLETFPRALPENTSNQK